MSKSVLLLDIEVAQEREQQRAAEAESLRVSAQLRATNRVVRQRRRRQLERQQRIARLRVEHAQKAVEVAEAPWSVAEWAVALRFDNPRATVLVRLLG